MQRIVYLCHLNRFIMKHLNILPFKILVIFVLSLSFSNAVFSQTDEAFCSSVEELLKEMYNGFADIRGELYASYGDDEYLATKTLPGALMGRIRDSETPVMQNIFIEDEKEKDVAFAKYEELLAKLKACKPDSWEEQNKTKVQDYDKKSYRFYHEEGELTTEIVLTAWNQFKGYTVTIRFSQR